MTKATEREQELLELLNRLRMFPRSELSILLKSQDPYIRYALFDYYQVNINELRSQFNQLESVAPLAWSSQLQAAAANHNQTMINRDLQAHTLPGELSLSDRLAQAGYQASFYGENLYGSALSTVFAHAGWAINWGKGDNTIGGIQALTPHRQNMMNSAVREVGISAIVESNNQTKIGPLVITENFGNRTAIEGKAWLLGVTFEDRNADGWYQAGEGLSDIDVEINGINGTDFKTTIGVSNTGAYQQLLNPGQYQVNFIRQGKTVSSQFTSIDADVPHNVKVDLVLPIRNLGTDLQTGANETHLLDFRVEDLGNGKVNHLVDRQILTQVVGVSGDADYDNYVGLYRVENSQGTVIDPTTARVYNPGDAGYVEAALRRSKVEGDGMSFDREQIPTAVTLKGGYIYAPFIVADGSVNDVLNADTNRPQVYFNYQAANADRQEHIRMLSPNKFGFEDMIGGGDRDYNDFIFQIVGAVA